MNNGSWRSPIRSLGRAIVREISSSFQNANKIEIRWEKRERESGSPNVRMFAAKESLIQRGPGAQLFEFYRRNSSIS